MKQKIVVLLLTVCLIGVPIAVSSVDDVSDGTVTSDFEETEYVSYDFSTEEYSTYTLTEEYTVDQTWDLLDSDLVDQMTVSQNTIDSSVITSFGDVSGTLGVIGTDTRFYTYPYSNPYCAVAYLTCGDYRGTAYIVSEHVMITAAHCVADDETGRVYGNVYVYFGLYSSSLSSASYTKVQASVTSYPTAYFGDNGGANSKYDYCILTFEDAIVCDYYFNCIKSGNVSTDETIYVTGYPKYHTSSSTIIYYQMTSSGAISSRSSYMVYYSNDTSKGMSGGPIYYKSSWECIGIITGEYYYTDDDTKIYTKNSGVLFWSTPYSSICSNIAAYE
ncbi:MAG: serine protease [Firmicutes bacterium]|nr:serine protease [Bacillota bacterium]